MNEYMIGYLEALKEVEKIMIKFKERGVFDIESSDLKCYDSTDLEWIFEDMINELQKLKEKK